MLALAPAALAIVVAGCGGGGSTNNNGVKAAAPAGANPGTAATTGAETVDLRTTQLGRILVDAQGRSLYLFEKDTGTASTCYGACAGIWPPLTVSGTPNAGAGVAAGKLGTTKRTDGKTEVTYNGHPLYYYVADTAPGQTQGQGLNQFGAGWDVLAPIGNKIEGGGK
jgi:predicted lipoprotein with Yx(FWY)xxD motif